MTSKILEDWTGPLGGVPAFDRVNAMDFSDAIEHAITAYRADLAQITDDVGPPSFTNVMEPFDRAGELFTRVTSYYFVWQSSLRDDRMREIEAQIEPRLAAWRDEIIQNARLFQKIEAVATNAAEQARLSPEQRRLCEVILRKFILRGARLNDSAKLRVTEINQRLATCGTTFDNNVMADEQRPALILSRVEDLDGLPEAYKASARAEAERRGHPGKFVVANTRSSVEPFLSYAHDRRLRESAFRAWTARGEATNVPIATETLRLRRERANLFGFPTHAHWKLADKMITDPARAMDLMMAVWRPARAQALTDIAGMQAIVDEEGGRFKLAAWDHRYYAEKLRRQRFDLDPNEVSAYMSFENVRNAMFAVAKRLYGLEFTPIEVPVYHLDVRTYRVDDGGKPVGLFYLDPYARPGKSSGAWMSQYRPQSYRDGRRVSPIVSNNENFVRGEAGQSIRLSWDDARTMFHEFGHGLHGLCTDVRYTTLQGTQVATDYVEFPSHFHENYLRTPEVLSHFKNDAGQSMPRELVEKILRAETFNAAFATVEFLGPALIDMKFHAATEEIENPEAAAREILNDLGMPSEIAPRHALPHFAHAFVGDGYSAGYYSYLWSDVLASDGFEAFVETGDAYSPEVAGRLRLNVLSAGNREDPLAAYRKFRGREPEVAALLRARGLTSTGETRS